MAATFEREFPLSRPHVGIPMANGQMGVLIWGKDRICLTVNRSDYWDHRFGDVYLGPQYNDLCRLYDPLDVTPIEKAFIRAERPYDNESLYWTSTRLPCGRFELKLTDRLIPQKAVLDYESGIVTVNCSNGKKIHFCMDLQNDLMLIKDDYKIISDVSFVSAYSYVGDKLKAVGFDEPQDISENGLSGEIQSVPADESLAAVCFRHDCGWLITLQRGLDNSHAFSEACRFKNYYNWEQTRQNNASWWYDFWQKVPTVNIPDDFLNDFYKFALYKFTCATHPNGIACGLQGPWVEEYQLTPWSGDYHFNVNIQQIYTIAFATGTFEHLVPLFDMLESDSFQKVMSENALNMFGIEDGLLLTHAVDDNGRQCGGIHPGAVLDFACGAWVAQLYWLYYAYTLDEKFLRCRAMPFIRGIMRAFEEVVKEHNGELSIPLSISAEYGCTFKIKKDGRFIKQNTGPNPSNQLFCFHMLADILIQACEILNEKPKEIWFDIKKRLPEYTLIDDDDKPRIGLWQHQDLDVCHRHHSHLACIYPFDTFNNTLHKKREIIDNTVQHWIKQGMGQWSEWCYPWAAIIQARMGYKEAPAVLLDLWKKLFINEGWATVYLPNFEGLSVHRSEDMKKPRHENEIMQLDGTMAGATAILEMLVHTKGNTVYLLEGVPEKWLNISFENIYLPGAFNISAILENGHMSSLSIRSQKGGRLKIMFNKNLFELDFATGEKKIIFENAKLVL